MGRLPQPYTLGELAEALKALGEEPKWQQLPNTQQQHKSVKYKAVVNIWTSRGTVHVQGGGAQRLEDALLAVLGGGPGLGVAASAALPLGSDTEASAAVQDCWHLYVDGSCPQNRNVRERAVPAGWGVAVFRNGRDDVFSELYGPVVIDSGSPLSLGAEVGSNNTGELSSIGEALLWLRDEAPPPSSLPAVIHYDSQYAANIATRRNIAHKNQALAATVQTLRDDVCSQRLLDFAHVKGHSGILGNELADKLANKGAEGLHSHSSRRWCALQPLASSATSSASLPSGVLPAASRMPSSSSTAVDVPVDKPQTSAANISPETPTPCRGLRHFSADGEPLAKIRRLSLAGGDDKELCNSTNAGTQLLFGPLHGMPLAEAALESPVSCARAVSELQEFVCAAGLWESFLHFADEGKAQRHEQKSFVEGVAASAAPIRVD